MSQKAMEFGTYTFVENTVVNGVRRSPQQRMADFLEEAELAEQVGLDFIGVGEHHRDDFIVTSPAVVLAAVAARTKRIRLQSAVTVLSSDDPVRVFEEFTMLDLISNGRAEIIAGRGSFIESFPLFGYDLKDYDALFTEKLELLLKVRSENPVTWRGTFRAPLENQLVFPRPVQDPLPVWIGVGGTPQSVVRAATLGLPMVIAIIGGSPARFKPFADLYRRVWSEAGHDPAKLQLAIGSHGFLADTTAKAAELTWPGYLEQMGKIGRERGWPPPTRRQFDAEISPQGAVLTGDANAVVDKILWEHELLGMTRFALQFSVGSVPHKELLRSIEIYGTQVAPAVNKALASASSASSSAATDAA